MRKIRCIVTGSGSWIERVIFTKDFDRQTSKLLTPGFEVQIDKVIKDTLPLEFPREYILRPI